MIIRNKMIRPVFLIFSIFLLIHPADAEQGPEAAANLGNAVNSECNELNPVITTDGKTLYFCRDECPGGEQKQKIWISHLLPDGTWSEAELMPEPLNNENNNFVCSVSQDGNSLLLGSVYKRSGGMSRGISISHRTEDGWSFPEEVEIQNYYNLNDFGSFFLASDGKTLLMAIQRDDSFGERDIYISFLQFDGSWSEPQNIGATINTKGNEISPFLAPDGRTLYFSSDGRDGYGSADIYISRRLDDSWGRWSEPKNLGPEVNTENWDAYYKTSAKGDYAYMVSMDNSIGKSDIFRMEIPDDQRPDPVMLVSGKVQSYKSLKPLAATIRYETLPEGIEFAIARSDPSDGDYSVSLPVGKYYSYLPEADDYLGTNIDLDLKKYDEYTELEQDILLIPKKDSLICIRNLFFAYNSTRLSRESLQERKRLVKFLKENPNTVVEVSGHTDNIGSQAYNLILADRRARAAIRYLERNGIDEDRIIKKVGGLHKPVVPNKTDQDRALNRRVEFLVYRPDKEKSDFSGE